MQNIPLQARVECSDGNCGESTYVVINPVTSKLTHFVVEDKHASPTPVERLVPVSMIERSEADVIYLSCGSEEFGNLPPFTKTHFIENAPADDASVEAEMSLISPFVSPVEAYYTPVEVEQLQDDELAIRRFAQVEATDGVVGKVDEFMVEPESGVITHLVMTQGHLFGTRERCLPLSAVERVDEFTVYLRLSKAEVAALPDIPVKRNYNENAGPGIEVLAKVFDDSSGAESAWKNLEQQEKASKGNLKIHSAALLQNRAGDSAAIQDLRQSHTRRGRIIGTLAGGAVGLAIGPVGAIVGAIAGFGAGRSSDRGAATDLSEKLLRELQAEMDDDSAALVIVAEYADSAWLSDVLENTEGVFVRQSLTDSMVENLLSDESAE